jgi:hypothetical protein
MAIPYCLKLFLHKESVAQMNQDYFIGYMVLLGSLQIQYKSHLLLVQCYHDWKKSMNPL